MDKQTTFALVDEVSGEVFVKNLGGGVDFVKSASYDNFEPEVADYIKNKLVRKEGKSYLLINAMGSSDYFSSNLNGDWFDEESLKMSHKTFEIYGHQFRHHVNKDPKIAEGKVLFSHFNTKMHRVELVTEVDSKKVGDILGRLERGEMVATSMAAKVPYDICSICGHKSKAVSEYCFHLKMYKNQIHTPANPVPGAKRYGQKVYAINPDPKFFDISFVRIPADATSSVLTKIAEAFIGKVAASEKVADIVKEVAVPLNGELITSMHGHIPRKVMKKLASVYTMPQIMTTMINMNMFPGRADYQYMQMTADGLNKEAEVLYDRGIVFDIPESPDLSIISKVAGVSFSDALSEALLPFASELGLGKPLVLSRILSMDKQAEEEHIVNTIPYLAGVGGAYYGYNALLNHLHHSGLANKLFELEKLPGAKNKLTRFLLERPAYFAAGILGAGALVNKLQRNMLNKQAGFKPEYANKFLLSNAIIAPIVFLYAANARRKSLEGVPLSKTERLVANHPFMSALTASSIAPAFFKKKASAEDYLTTLFLDNSEEFDKLYKEILG